MSDVPNPIDDLNVKALDAIAWLETAYRSGQFDKSQYVVGVQSLFMATSGLLNDDVMELLSEMDISKESNVHWNFDVLIKDGHDIAIVKREAGGFDVEFYKHVGQPIADVKKVECMSPAAARHKAGLIVDGLIEKGYAKL